MFSHIMIGSDDLDRSRRFYDALFGAIGGDKGFDDAKGRLVYAHNGGHFIITRPINGEAAAPGNGTTIGFTVEDPGQAQAWHAAGTANGGTAIEDAPGVRNSPMGELYLAYLRDPDGNKLCALHRMAG